MPLEYLSASFHFRCLWRLRINGPTVVFSSRGQLTLWLSFILIVHNYGLSRDGEMAGHFVLFVSAITGFLLFEKLIILGLWELLLCKLKLKFLEAFPEKTLFQ